jgi:glycosyltransferase involved in cell wall biosynthesis
MIRFANSAGFVFEQMPLVREFCGTLYLWARKPSPETLERKFVPLAPHEELAGSTSVVVPCHNEEMNVAPLAAALLGTFDKYIQEIIFVNDNSSDRTAAVVEALATRDSRIRLVNRQAPAGVGRAIRDGCAAATGRYILTTDCDFVAIVPEMRDLFDAIAEGFDGAIGSRFSHESVLINYPFSKILCNRLFHLAVRCLLRVNVRDISNNLKLYRADILKSLLPQENHFAANIETGLRPVLAGYRIKEVPISWINRDYDMGTSTFRLLKVGPRYSAALIRMMKERNTHSRRVGRAATVR